MNNKNREEPKEYSLEDNISSIKFKRKKTKSNIRLGSKLFLFLIIAGMSGAFFSNLTIKREYGELLEKAKANTVDENNIILNYTDITKVVSPSLVSISNSSENLTSNTYYNDNLTGVILDEEGTILTNFSKVKYLENIYVKLAAKGTPPIKAEFIGGDEDIDLAIIKIKYDGKLKPVKLAKIESVVPGQGIAVLSNSIGDDYIGNVVPGIITSTTRKHADNENSKKYNLLEINAPINSQNTGGAVCNSKGELIGIASVDITNKNKQEGLFYAIDLSELETVISSTTEFKSLLGLTGGSLVGGKKNDASGFYVENVKKDGNAYKAGIKPTDIIFEVEGSNIITGEDMTNVLENKKVGDIISCKVMRNGIVKEISIILHEV